MIEKLERLMIDNRKLLLTISLIIGLWSLNTNVNPEPVIKYLLTAIILISLIANFQHKKLSGHYTKTVPSRNLNNPDYKKRFGGY